MCFVRAASSRSRGLRIAIHDLESRVIADILLRKVPRFVDGPVGAHMHEGKFAVGAIITNLEIRHPNSVFAFH